MGTLVNETTLTQCAKILQHMREHGTITQAQAVDEIRCYRLAARIADLEQRGHKIRHELVCDKNSDGKPIRYARYSLIEEMTV